MDRLTAAQLTVRMTQTSGMTSGIGTPAQGLTVVIGGTGKTGRRVAERLAGSGHAGADRLAHGRARVRLGGPGRMGAGA